ncbi:hypothetical protein CCACVL1_25430 [Corchorus capsularis]|uniref:Uncharacterized protein n=1 Tax=Corchorus capsularis TaxID=210143 RepID=A0A1R3GKI5_COCAP|nr:hypothetical protein CCACVL1_25430 [Corchorus capsularis]
MAYEITCAILTVIVHHKSTILALHLSSSSWCLLDFDITNGLLFLSNRGEHGPVGSVRIPIEDAMGCIGGFG